MRKFKTESKKLLDLMINSIYTDREIFLRELISNASDALDKRYFDSMTNDSDKVTRGELSIHVDFDKEARTITVSDNGIGMTAEQLEKNLGTIAHSDSMAFKQENDESQGEDIDIIGQFGVGFYSAFMVASKVVVTSKSAVTGEANSWTSDGVEGYTIAPADKAEVGTTIVLSVKENTEDEKYDEYLSEYGLTSLIKRYSNYVRYPVRMNVSKQRELPKPDDAGEDYTPQYEDYTEEETINSMIPIWKRRKSEVSQEEYNEFYKTDFHDFTDPARTFSVHAEGTLTYDALLFVPGRAPYDLYSKEYKKGLALYSSNVMIMEKCEELVPDCFNFIRGVVDSPDLTLNISRETLQQDKQLRVIARKLEKKIKSELVSMRDNDREAYETFFKDFGRGLKFGVYSSYGARKDLLADLLLFYSAKQEKMVTFDEYIAAMPADQKHIYYAAGDSADRLAKMPIVTTVLGKGYDVLLCTEDLDEFCLNILHDYDEKELKNVAGGDLDLETEEEKKQAEDATKANEGLLGAMKNALGEKVKKVAVSTRLTDAPACITAEGPISLEMERIMASEPGANAEDIRADRVLELNAAHPVFETLKAAEAAGDTQKVSDYTEILYDQALLVEGLPIDDPVAYTQAVCKLMK